MLGETGSGGEKDLDAQQPAHAKSEGDNDVYVSSTLEPKLDAYGDTEIAAWTGGVLPEYGDCAGTVAAASATELPLKVGDVFCVRTAEGHVARLQAQKVDGESGYLVATFAAEIWTPGG